MSGDWAKYETVRGKGCTVNCMFCGRKPQILEKGFHDGSHVFSISCPHCWNKHFRDKRETGVDITVCSKTVYPGIRDWNKVNGAFDRGYRKALKDVEYQLTDNLYKHVMSRQQGEWTTNGNDLEYICSVCGEDLPYSDEYDYQTNFCPNCGAPMNEKAFRKYNGLKEGKAEEKKPCPCNTCQTAIDRCGCQMHLCSEYQKWKEGEAE